MIRIAIVIALTIGGIEAAYAITPQSGPQESGAAQGVAPAPQAATPPATVRAMISGTIQALDPDQHEITLYHQRVRYDASKIKVFNGPYPTSVGVLQPGMRVRAMVEGTGDARRITVIWIDGQ